MLPEQQAKTFREISSRQRLCGFGVPECRIVHTFSRPYHVCTIAVYGLGAVNSLSPPNGNRA